MSRLGTDEDAELTGCGFGACFCADIFISLPRCDPSEEFRWKSRPTQRSPLPVTSRSVYRLKLKRPARLGPGPLRFLVAGVLFRARTGRGAARSCSRKRGNAEVAGRVQLQLGARAPCVNGAALLHLHRRFCAILYFLNSIIKQECRFVLGKFKQMFSARSNRKRLIFLLIN